MHHVVGNRIGLIISDFVEFDHIDRNPLNNQRTNLRLVTRTQNQYNKDPQTNNTSTVTGVHYCIRDRKWIARISKNRKRIVIGYFDSFEEAVQARKRREKRE
jgi:hypothetical protein